jgi:hypothetical protein
VRQVAALQEQVALAERVEMEMQEEQHLHLVAVNVMPAAVAVPAV